jgi:hypothetical protein
MIRGVTSEPEFRKHVREGADGQIKRPGNDRN